MAIDRWISLERAKSLLTQVAYFMRPGKPGVSDFILPGKEAIMLAAYTGAFFILSEGRRWRLRPVAGLLSRTEPMEVLEDAGGFPEYVYTSEIVPIFSTPMSAYLKLFPGWKEDKHLIMVDCSKYRSRKGYVSLSTVMEATHGQLKAGGLNLSDCVLWPSTSDGTYGEDFWEYLSCLLFRSKGYFVTAFNLGGGDVSAYYIPEYLRKLQQAGIIDHGAFLEELELFDRNKRSSTGAVAPEQLPELICIEAESSERRTRSHGEDAGVGQVLKFVQPGYKYDARFISYSLRPLYYTHAFVAGPYCEDTLHSQVGIISCSEEGELILKKGEVCREPTEEGVSIISNLLKASLLRNLSMGDRLKCLGLEEGSTFDKYYERLLAVSLDDVLASLTG